jgi:DNA-binding transcriptional ArsR family regulator
LRLVRDGTITNYRHACKVFENVSWPVIRKVLKELRDEGKIDTDREYTNIAPVSHLQEQSRG